MNVTEAGIVASKEVLPKSGGKVTRGSILEYAEAVRPRYRRAGKEERGRILDEFCQTTGYHRKSAVRLLNRRIARPVGRRGRTAVYGPAVAEALRRVWVASDRLCSKRLVAFLPELVPILEAHGELVLTPEVRAQLIALSAATVDRLLRPERERGPRRLFTHQTAAAHLRAQIPVRTFGDWDGATAGALQADLVAHCGASGEGFFLTTLDAVDVATGWTECVIVWGKGQERVRSALHRVRRTLPFALREVHTDNGSEFLNGVLYPWCQREGIRLTRGRPYRKNDQAYVEQKNWSVVRRLIGYDRYASKAAYAVFERLYRLIRLWVNYFQPLRKLVKKERVGAKVVKRYDTAQTPYQRVLASQILTEERRDLLSREYQSLNPVRLRGQIDAALEELWALAERTRALEGASAPTQAVG